MNSEKKQYLWGVYKKSVENGKLKDIETLIEDASGSGLTESIKGFESSGSHIAVEFIVDELLQKFGKMKKIDKEESNVDMDDIEDKQEQQLVEMGLDFLKASERRNIGEIRDFIASGFPVNFQHPLYLSTVMHKAATRDQKEMVFEIGAAEKFDYLLRDHLGKTAYDNAMIFGCDPEIREFLMNKTVEQARDAGINYGEERREHLKKWEKQEWYQRAMSTKFHGYDDENGHDDDSPSP